MTRPRRHYRIAYYPKFRSFRPDGSQSAEIVALSCAETEALRLKNIKGLHQIDAAKQMDISQSTFQRLLTSAYKKVSEALIYGRPIAIEDRKN